jgi:selenide, water dikinase
LPLFQGSDLELDARGFVKIHSTLQAVGHDHVFAAGDCASLTAAPETPKAGVYAVRQGPFLEHNLRALLSGRPLKNYRPQRDFLTLLNLGDGTAIGGKWGLAGRAPALMRLKDRIDRRFMERFQVLDFKGVPTPNFKPMTEMEMFCGGCAAKIGQTVLERALRRLPAALTAKADLGLKEADDVAAVRLGSEVVVSSIDAFRAFTDDPYLVGRVAAINAVSDLFAKGVEPDHALLLVALPQDLDNGASEELLFQVASGVRAALDPLEVELVGGHTTTAPELLVGLTVIGRQNPARPLATKSGLEVGQILILTKALGTGVVLHADMKAQLRGEWLETALASMLRPNAAAAEAALGCGAGAMTDVTGFGLVGHLADLLRASHLGARLRLGALPVLPGALELLERGLRSTFHEKNAAQRRGLMVAPELQDAVALELLFDPQTSGGLLFGIPAEKAEQTLERLHAVGDHAARAIGEVVPLRSDGVRILVE